MALAVLLLLALAFVSARSASLRLTGGVVGTVVSVIVAQVAPPALLVGLPVATLGVLTLAGTPATAAVEAVLTTQLSGFAMGVLVLRGVPPLVAMVGGSVPTLLPDLAELLSRHGAELLRPNPADVERSVAMTLDIYRRFKVPEEQLAQSRDVLTNVSAFLVSLVPAFQFLGVLAVFFLIYLGSQALLARLGLAIRPIGRFPLWRLSHWYAWLFAAGLLAVLLPGEPLQVVGRNVIFVMVIAYFIQGLSVTQFLMVRRGVGLLVRLFVYGVGMVAVLPFFAAMTTGIGLFDTWFDFRGLEPRPADEGSGEDGAEDS